MKKSSNVFVLDLANYNAPKAVEEIGRKLVFYGSRNRYFKYINECYRGSVTNRSIIKNVSQMIYGKGLNTTDETKLAKLEEIKNLFKAKDLKRLSLDYKKYGQACFQVGYSGSGKKRKVVKVMHHPVETIAKGKKNKKGETEEFYFSINWNRSGKEYTTIPAFGTSNEKVELYYIDGDISIVDYFADCDYQAGLQYCKIEEELSNFHINNIQNGFNPSAIINFNNGIPQSEDLQREVERDVLRKWSGTSKAGKTIISFNDGPENAPTVEVLPISDAANQYELVSNEARDKIIMAHRITSPMLVGLTTSNGIASNTDELVTSYLLFSVSVVEPFQNDILNAINEVLAINGMEDDQLFFEKAMPAYFASKSIESIDTSKIDDETINDIEKELGTGIKIEQDGVTEGQK